MLERGPEFQTKWPGRSLSEKVRKQRAGRGEAASQASTGGQHSRKKVKSLGASLCDAAFLGE